MLRAATLVGLLLVGSAAALSWFIVSTSKDRYDEGSSYVVFADFDDASGIRWKTRVQINGIDVGKIEDITHERTSDGRLVARVRIRLLNRYQLFQDARVRKAAESLLGDFRLDLDPGTPAAATLPPGSVITRVVSISDIDRIQNELLAVTHNVAAITDSFFKVLAGPEGEGSLKSILERVDQSMGAIEETTRVLSDSLQRNDAHVNAVISNMARFSKSVADSTSSGGAVTELTENLRRLSAKLETIASSVAGIVSRDPNEVAGAGAERATVEGALGEVNVAAGHLKSIARKIDAGQGSLGRVVNDPGIAEKVEKALDDTSELIGSLSRLETRIELRSEVDVPFRQTDPNTRQEVQAQAAIKNTLGVWLMPKPDKYYILEAVADPRGAQARTVTKTHAESGAVVTEGETEETVISFDKLKFSAQFAKRYYFLTLRFGIIENSGGIGLNFNALRDRLELKIDAFQFDRRDPLLASKTIFPRLRGAAIYEFVKHISLQAGLDDPLNTALRTWFVGGVLRFTDDDLKAILAVAPKP